MVPARPCLHQQAPQREMRADPDIAQQCVNQSYEDKDERWTVDAILLIFANITEQFIIGQQQTSNRIIICKMRNKVATLLLLGLTVKTG